MTMDVPLWVFIAPFALLALVFIASFALLLVVACLCATYALIRWAMRI